MHFFSITYAVLESVSAKNDSSVRFKNASVILCILNTQKIKMTSYPGAAEGTRGQTCGCSANGTRPVTDSKRQALPSRLICKHQVVQFAVYVLYQCLLMRILLCPIIPLAVDASL